MTQTRLTILLNRDERSALRKLADQERRELKYQAAWLIRQALIKLDLLQSDEPQPETAQNDQA